MNGGTGEAALSLCKSGEHALYPAPGRGHPQGDRIAACLPSVGSWEQGYFRCRTAPDSLRGATDVTDQDRPGQLIRVIRMANTAHSSTAGHGAEGTRRDFLYLTAGAFGAVGAGATLWPFIHQMNPSADRKSVV